MIAFIVFVVSGLISVILWVYAAVRMGIIYFSIFSLAGLVNLLPSGFLKTFGFIEGFIMLLIFFIAINSCVKKYFFTICK